MCEAFQIQNEPVFIKLNYLNKRAVIAIKETAVATCTVIHLTFPFPKDYPFIILDVLFSENSQ